MRHLLASTNYERHNGRIQLNTAAICSRARLRHEERGRNKAGSAGPRADPHQLCLCRYAGCFQLGCRGRREEEEKHVGTKRGRRKEWVRTCGSCREKRSNLAHTSNMWRPENAITLWWDFAAKNQIGNFFDAHSQKINNRNTLLALQMYIFFRRQLPSIPINAIHVKTNKRETKRNKISVNTHCNNKQSMES